MKAQGNLIPQTVLIERYHPQPSLAELRIRQNPIQIAENLYEYDEYIAHIPFKENLEEEVSKNLQDWVTTLRQLEFNQNSSVYQEMMQAFNIIGIKEE